MSNISNYKIENLSGIGKRRKDIYNKLGISDIESLLHFFPRSYIDYTKYTPIKECINGSEVFIKAKVLKKLDYIKIKKNLTIYSISVIDEEFNTVNIKIFNSKYNYDLIIPGNTYYFHGKYQKNRMQSQITLKSFIDIYSKEKILPIYKLTNGISQNIIRNNIKQAFAYINLLNETIPDYIKNKYKLCDKSFAIKNIHFPDSNKNLDKAKEFLIFEECLALQLGILKLKQYQKSNTDCIISDTDLSEFYNILPFNLSNGQINSINDCIKDMQNNTPMNRLIQGDVGSGKTVVAAAISYCCYKNNMQSCIMVPTEILAEQHYNTFINIFSKLGLNIALLTGSTTQKQKKRIKSYIESGIYDIIIGTHALIQDDFYFKRLGLVITDEQHRFGVLQRSMLISKGNNPHVCVMSATPIPRTLALIIYGGLDISIIDSIPLGRKKIETYSITPDKRKRAFNFIKNHIGFGEQAYIICPLVEEGKLDLANVTKYHNDLSSNFFKTYKLGLLHGKLSSKEKEDIMQKFKNKEIDILISTTVVEVGVDIPNATIIMIENAERFGLSQLHQLRGRVGRGNLKSYCILVSENKSKRLQFMCKTNDGFTISEYDLKLRGPGDFFGSRQHGLPELKIANMINNTDIFKETLHISKSIILKDPNLSNDEHANLKKLVNSLFDNIDNHCFN